MSKTGEIIDTVNTITDIVFLGLLLLQQISGKSKDEVLDMIKSEGAKTDKLLKQLRPVK